MIDRLGMTAAVFLLAVWVLYPLAIALVAHVRRARRPQPTSPPFVSVVIATREDDAIVEQRVRNVLETDYPLEQMEIIAARDAAHADAPAPLAVDASALRVVAADPPGGKASALNAGVRAARGEIVVFADSFQNFARETIPRLVEAFADPRTGAVSGRLEVPSSSLASRYWSYERWLRRNEARLHSSIGATGAVYAIRRDLWKPLAAGLLLDDVYTPMRIVMAGYRVAFSERAIAVETRHPSPRQEYVRKVRTLTGVLQLCAWLPGVLVPVRNPVWIQFVFHKLLRMLTPYALAVLGVWAVVSGVRLAGSAAPLLALIAAVPIAWVAMAKGARARRLRHLLHEGALLQWAVVTAGFNGLRGRWRVWDA